MAMMFLSRKRNKKSRFKLFSGNPASASWGTLIPTNVTRVVAGDDFSFQPGVGVQALPIVAPFLGNVCVKKEYFFIPDRIYNVDRQLNFQGVTDTPNTVYKPSMAPQIPFDINNPSGDAIAFSVTTLQTDSPGGSLGSIVGPGSLADYMGEAPGSVVTGIIDLTPYIGYIDIYYNYYLNQQYPLVPTSLAGTVSDSAMEYPYFLDVRELETYLRTIKTTPNTSPAIRADDSASYSTNVDAALRAVNSSAFRWSFFTGRQSLFQRGFPSYYLEAWLKTSSFSDAAVDISTSGNSVSMRNITFASRMQRYMDLAFAGGGRNSDFYESQFDVKLTQDNTCPAFLGSDSFDMNVNTLYQTTGFEDSSSPLGAFSGQLSGGTRFRRRNYHFNDDGYFMEITSIVPRVYYPSYINPTSRQISLGQQYAPALDNIAMQGLRASTVFGEVQSLGATNPTYANNVFVVPGFKLQELNCVGYEPAWSELMTAVSKPHGRLCNDLDYWVLSRDYGRNLSSVMDTPAYNAFIKAAGTHVDELSLQRLTAFFKRIYVSPSSCPYILCGDFNYVFYDQRPTAENFILDNVADIVVFREKSKVNVATTL
ncbi:major capsid protein [Parasutterella excrementihominis]|uniref:major capsid protein n=1 Tax=Parasutterella excrementihominis TaxID=487175 RepID=UPI0026667EE3|nr:major capsid protein [Parasutterella excrementihominis]